MGLFSKKQLNIIDIVAKGDKELLLRAMREGSSNLDQRDYRGWTPLKVAISMGNTEIVETLLKYGVLTNLEAPLVLACAIKNTEIIKLLLDYRADPSQKDSNGWTPLMVAAQNGDMETVKLLLGKGAKVSAQNNDGWTALHAAIENNYTDVALLLLESNADPFVKSNKNETPFSLATKNSNQEILKRINDYREYISSQHGIGNKGPRIKPKTVRKRKQTTIRKTPNIDRFGMVLHDFLYSVKHDKDLPECSETRIREGNKITKKIIICLLSCWISLMVFFVFLRFL